MPPFVPPTIIMNVSSSTYWFKRKKHVNIIFGLDPLFGSEPEQKKLFFRKTVHTVHLPQFPFIFRQIRRERLVNSEHFTVHLAAIAPNLTSPTHHYSPIRAHNEQSILDVAQRSKIRMDFGWLIPSGCQCTLKLITTTNN